MGWQLVRPTSLCLRQAAAEECERQCRESVAGAKGERDEAVKRAALLQGDRDSLAALNTSLYVLCITPSVGSVT